MAGGIFVFTVSQILTVYMVCFLLSSVNKRKRVCYVFPLGQQNPPKSQFSLCCRDYPESEN